MPNDHFLSVCSQKNKEQEQNTRTHLIDKQEPLQDIMSPSNSTNYKTSNSKSTLDGLAHCIFEVPQSLSKSDDSLGRIFVGPQQAQRCCKNPPFTGIVNCTNNFPNIHEGSIEYCRVAVNDECGANILVYLNGATKFIDRHIQCGGSVLIHCEMGISRSATVAIAYLMKYHSFSRDAAFQHTKECRAIINPNPGFWSQLRLFEERLNSHTEKAGEVHFDRSWAEESLAEFQTLGQMCVSAEYFSEITSQSDIEQILFVATDFLLGRGANDTDLPWFSSLCQACQGFHQDPENFVLCLFTEGTDFSELWSGEIYPAHIKKIKSALNAKILFM